MQKTIYIVLAFTGLIALLATQTSISGTTAINDATINNATIRGGGDVVVSGAGASTYNGTYTYAGTDDEGDPYYTYDSASGTRYLFLAKIPVGFDTAWRLNTTLQPEGTGPADSAYYGTINAGLPANPWSVGNGIAPAPTVSIAD